MLLTSKEIAKKVGCGKNTLLPYLGRAEFYHIHKRFWKYDVSEDQINRLKELVHGRKNHGIYNGKY